MRDVFLLTIFSAGLVVQVLGVVLVVLDIRDDVRTARRIVGAEPPIEIDMGNDFRMGGVTGESLARSEFYANKFTEFVRERLGGSLRRRVWGVVLIVLGALIAFVGDVASTLT